jgi:hypothetical protein
MWIDGNGPLLGGRHRGEITTGKVDCGENRQQVSQVADIGGSQRRSQVFLACQFGEGGFTDCRFQLGLGRGQPQKLGQLPKLRSAVCQHVFVAHDMHGTIVETDPARDMLGSRSPITS